MSHGTPNQTDLAVVVQLAGPPSPGLSYRWVMDSQTAREIFEQARHSDYSAPHYIEGMPLLGFPIRLDRKARYLTVRLERIDYEGNLK